MIHFGILTHMKQTFSRRQAVTKQQADKKSTVRLTNEANEVASFFSKCGGPSKAQLASWALIQIGPIWKEKGVTIPVLTTQG